MLIDNQHYNVVRVLNIPMGPSCCYGAEMLIPYHNDESTKATDIWAALQQLHSIGIIYADMKSDNMGYSVTDQCWKLFDFDGCGIVKDQVFKRVINELLASRIYSHVFGLNTLDMKILYKRSMEQLPQISQASNFLLVSKFISIKSKDFHNVDIANISRGFLVDCIMGNWDVLNNENVGVIDISVPIRPDVGGCLAFRGKGDYKISFDVNVIPRDHITISSQPSFKTLGISKRHIIASKNYLKMITKVEDKLQEVRYDFNGIFACLRDQNTEQIYKRFVDKLCNAVLYRYKWYLDNAEKVISEMFDGVGYHENNGNPQPLSQSPVAFTLTQQQLHEKLDNLLVCKN